MDILILHNLRNFICVLEGRYGSRGISSLNYMWIMELIISHENSFPENNPGAADKAKPTVIEGGYRESSSNRFCSL